MRDDPAYILTHDVARFDTYEAGYTADLIIENIPMEGRLRIFEEEPLDIPDPVIYRGYLPIVETLDFPVANNSWLIMSKRMIDALDRAGTFRRREYGVEIEDGRMRPREFDDDGPQGERIMDTFVAVQLIERLDIFDFERSRFESDPDFPDFIGDVDEYVLKIPLGGLPPLFHIEGEPIKVFVSHDGRIALKESGIRGVEYISLGGIRGGDGMFIDVPVPAPADAEGRD